MTANFLAQGIVLSNVACHNERRRTAQRLNKDISEVPLRYGSVRVAINRLQLDGVLYSIDKSSDDEDIRENRLILEISYKFDEDENIVEEHEIVNDLIVGQEFDLHMNHTFIKKNHLMKVINPGTPNAIRSYFIKSWADHIDFLTPAEVNEEASSSIKPIEVVHTFNVDKSLVLA